MENNTRNKEIEKSYKIKKVGMYVDHYVHCFGDGLIFGTFMLMLLSPLIKRGGVAKGVAMCIYTVVSIPYVICSAEYKTSFLKERERILEIQEQNEYII